MARRLTFRNLGSNEITNVLAKLNEEFIYSKDRAMPLELRFPGQFAPGNSNNLFGAFIGDHLVSFAAGKPVSFYIATEEIPAFFVGCVFTVKGSRGQGYSSRLMRHVQEHYISRGASFGMLWTGQHAFYERLGWVSMDSGVTLKGTLICHSDDACSEYTIKECGDALLLQVDEFRRANASPFIRRLAGRQLSGYHTVYPPGEAIVRLVSLDRKGNVSGYLLGSSNASTCFIYEIEAVGNDDNLKLKFLDYLRKRYKLTELTINLFKGDSLIDVLCKDYENVHAAPSQTQMIFVPGADIPDRITNICVSFSDRI